MFFFVFNISIQTSLVHSSISVCDASCALTQLVRSYQIKEKPIRIQMYISITNKVCSEITYPQVAKKQCLLNHHHKNLRYNNIVCDNDHYMSMNIGLCMYDYNKTLHFFNLESRLKHDLISKWSTTLLVCSIVLHDNVTDTSSVAANFTVFTTYGHVGCGLLLSDRVSFGVQNLGTKEISDRSVV